MMSVVEVKAEETRPGFPRAILQQIPDGPGVTLQRVYQLEPNTGHQE
jgi:hypothetical protein